ncbi:MAG: EamA family transporter RarD [Acidimicrobiia bacterium]|nr:EamA family transporter RarD [Acidimicrobiia bacterium]
MNRGMALGVSAYLLWGILPIYWKALETVGAVEILAHRIVWSMVLLTALVGIRRSWPQIRSLNRRSVIRLLIAGALLTVNWATYIWAVNNGHIVEASLGYFINPLLNVALGVMILRERLDPAQWLAIGVAAAGVVYMTITVGSVPWIALVLATSFALYAFLKKQMLALGPFESLTVEIALVLIPALAFLVVLAVRGSSSFGVAGTRTTVLLLLAGLATALPLLLFGAAATRIPLSTIGILQYIAPTMQFLIGVFVYDEVVGRDRLIGFVLVWIALAIYTGSGLARRRRMVTQPLAA